MDGPSCLRTDGVVIAQANRADVPTSSTMLPSLDGHIPALDGLRGLAILAVMLCHFVPYSDHPQSAMGRLFFFTARLGWSGVHLFFVLSGFLITNILWRNKSDAHYFRNFYGRRTLRIFPLYYGVLIAVFLIVPLINPHAFAATDVADVRHRQAWLWLYLGNIPGTWNPRAFEGGWINLNPFWSLAVEEHFYLVWPWVILLFARRGAIRVSVALMVAALLIRTWLFFGLKNYHAIYLLTPCRMDALACGALLALGLRGGAVKAKPMIQACKAGAVLFGLLALVVILQDNGSNALAATLGYSIVALFFGSVMVTSIATPDGSWLSRGLQSSILLTLGKYSYGLYVYHTILGPTFENEFGQPIIKSVLASRLGLGHAAYGISVLLYMLVAISASLAVAWVSWQLFEQPLLSLKKHFKFADPVSNGVGHA